jgi:deoxycytidylate deaminase
MVKLNAFRVFLDSLAGLSFCKRAQTAAIVLTPDLREVLAIGYNGPPAGRNNESCREVEGACGCIHAEANALVKLHSRASDLILLSSTSPCEHCAGLVINSGRIHAVIYLKEYRDRTGLVLLKEAEVVTLDLERAYEV